jgi:hypothetical protein
MNSLLPYIQSAGYSHTEWSSMLFLLLVGTIYFIIPVLGYSTSKRGVLAASMWAMICKLAIAIFRDCLLALQLWYAAPTVATNTWNVPAAGAPPAMVFSSTSPAGSSGLIAKFEEQLPALLGLAEMVAFLAAIILFVLGLQRLVRREPPPFQVPQHSQPG